MQSVTGIDLFYDDERQALAMSQPELLTGDEIGVRSTLYLTALRGLAGRVPREHRSPEHPKYADLLDDLRNEHRGQIRQLAIINNLEKYQASYQNGEIGHDFRPHQHKIVSKSLDYLSRDGLLTPGHMSVPTASGKSFISIKLLEAMGIGEYVTPHDPIPLRALYLVPRKLLLEQVIGKDGKRGFGKFAPNLRATPYHGSMKDLSGDVVVMTYLSYIKAAKTNVLDNQSFDVTVFDEAHHALGIETKRVIKKRRKSRPGIEFAMTASPIYNDKKAVSSAFPTEIINVNLLESIEDGSLASLQCWLYETNTLLRTEDDSSRAEFTEAELLPLRHDRARNEKGVSFVADFVKNGLQGIIRCVPGDGCAHAREFANLANQTAIIDPKTGTERQLRVAAIGTFLDEQEQSLLHEKFENGELDALAYVALLDEGWDSERAKFLLRLAPTNSKVVSVQSLGRILRPSAEHPVAQVVEFLDVLDGKKHPITFVHTLNPKTLGQGKIIGPEDVSTTKKFRGLRNVDFSQHLADKLARTEYKLLKEQLFEVQTPDDWVTSDILMQRSGMTSYTGLYRFLNDEHGIEPITSTSGRLYYPPECLDLIQTEIIERLAPSEFVPVSSTLSDLGINRDKMRRLMIALDIQPANYRNTATLHDRPHIKTADVQRIKDYIKELGDTEDKRISYEQLAVQLGITAKTLTKYIPSTIEPIVAHSATTGVQQRYLSHSQVKDIKKLLLPSYGSKTAQDLATEWSMSLSSIKGIITSDDTQKATVAMHNVTKRMLPHFPPQVIEQIRGRCNAPQDTVNAAMLMDLFHCSEEEIRRHISAKIEQSGKVWKVRRGTNTTDMFYPTSHIPTIAKSMHVDTETLIDELVSVSRLAKSLQTTDEAIIGYYAGGSHVRTIKYKDEEITFVLPGPLKEIRKHPPVREGWFTQEDIIKMATSNSVKVDITLLQRIKRYLESRTGSDITVMKPMSSKLPPRVHFAPHVVANVLSTLKPKQ